MDTAWLVTMALVGGGLAGSLLTKALQTGVVALVEKSVASHFDREIESLRSDLRLKESKITALQSTVLNGRAGRQALLDKRRIDAVETLWRDVIKLNAFHWPARMAEVLKLDAIADSANAEPNVKLFIDTVGGADLTEQLKGLEAETVRVFLPNDIWHLFSAYQGLLIFCYMRIKGASFGIGAKLFKDEEMLKQIKTVLPHFSQYLDDHGLAGAAGLASILRDSVLGALKLMLKNPATDMDDIVEVHDIMTKLSEIGQAQPV